MKRMAELQQQQEEEECTQEEMVTRFERQRSESIPTGTEVGAASSRFLLPDPQKTTSGRLPGPVTSLFCFPDSPPPPPPSAVVRAVPPDMVLRLVQDPEFRYEDFAPRGEQAPPTMRAQVWRERADVSCFFRIAPFRGFCHGCSRGGGATLSQPRALVCAGLFLGGPRLLSGQQAAARHGPVPG